MACGFYHLARMLLKVYRPSPRFAIRNVQRVMPESDVSSGRAESFALADIISGVYYGARPSFVWNMQKLARNCAIPHHIMSLYLYL